MPALPLGLILCLVGHAEFNQEGFQTSNMLFPNLQHTLQINTENCGAASAHCFCSLLGPVINSNSVLMILLGEKGQSVGITLPRNGNNS